MTDYAIVIGLNNYPAFDALKGPVRDAEEFTKWLVEQGKVPEANIRKVYSTDFNGQNVAGQPTSLTKPTLDAINAIFIEFVNLANRNFQKLPRIGRRLYIYLAGHGITPRVADNLDSAALLMSNAEPATAGLHLPGPAYANWFRQSHAFDEIILFMDCCRNAFDDIDQAAVPFTPLRGGDPTKVKTLYVLATQWDSPSFEQPLGNPPEPRGVFTYALIEVLRSGAGNASGQLTALGLKGHLELAISKLRHGDVPQFPRFRFAEDLVVLDRSAAALPTTTIHWKPEYHGRTADVLDGFDNPLSPAVRMTASATDTELRLKPGLYSLRFTDGVSEVLKVRAGLQKDAQDVGQVTVT